MKIRSDFVTNSSSSSYVIAFKDEQNDLLKYLLDWTGDNDTEEAEIYNDLESYAKYLIEDYGFDNLEEAVDEDDYVKCYYNEAKEYFGKGYKIAKKEVSYDNVLLLDLLRYMENKDKNNLIKVLES